jgi:hypothetical protein
MARFEYKDGCLLCNQCGRLYEKTEAGAPRAEVVECPCGNSETLDAITQLIELYNPPPPAGPAPEQK